MKILMLLTCLISTLSLSVWAQEDSLNSAFETSGNLTDQEAKEAKDFVHQGIKDETIKTECEKQGLGECNQNDVNKQGSVLKSDFGQALEQNIGKIYATIFGGMGFLGGSGPSVKVVSKDTAAAAKEAGGYKNADGKDIKKKDAAEQKADYCAYAAIGYELISGYIQTSLQNKIESDLQSEKDIQLKSLLALKKTHEARRKTSLYQGTIYGATSACYIARAASSQGRVVMDFQYWAKMSASAALSTLYYLKAKKHKDAAEAVQLVIDKLPKTGDCNPWTKTMCFCSEATSKTTYPDLYQEICVLNKGNPETPKMALGCGVMDEKGKMSFDKECKCKQTNTCFKTKVTRTGLKFGFGSNMMNQANKGFDLLGSGDFDAGQFDSYALQTGSYAAKMRDKIAVKGAPKINLSEKEKKIANDLKSDLPPSVAAMVARTPSMSLPGASGDGGAKSAMDKLPKELKEKVAETEPVKYSSGGPGFESVAATNEEGFKFPTVGESENQSGTEVLTFAEQAVNNADVSNAPDTPIFDIISNRYLRSGMNRLQIEDVK